MTGIQLNPTLITIEPVAGELRVFIDKHGTETVQIYTGTAWLEFAQPTYEMLLAENARLRAEIADLKDTILEMAEQQNYD